MVRSVWLTVAAIILCVALFIFTDFYLKNQLNEFSTAVDILYDKVENGDVTVADGEAVRIMWRDKKSKLQIFVPHNDISYIDYWLNEACSFLKTEHYDLALGNLEVVREITLNLPDCYTIKFENVF
ncbi:MAG: DUF4363 family protein [Clostridia bacterium]|nr:DUF4363 family protein [Clostridia bacterium]